jgi:uncharacterized protein YdiU (UPF0061 family)
MFPFDNTYARLPDRFFARVSPTPVAEPRVIRINRPLALELGLDPEALTADATAAWFSGNALPEGAEPIALAYAGHQFGHFVPQLGDGRAILLGEIVGRDGSRRDVQLKGSGRTPFSRGGDGRAALGPVLREYVVSEAMAALGIPTTRALAAVTTGERVAREEGMLPGAVLTRVAASHLRVGTFEYFAARDDREALGVLVGYALARHFPGAEGSESDARALLDRVCEAQARLVARWLGVGFVHGVMNTDNTSISGETIDYGPCAFLDEYDPDKTFSSIDRGRRYAFAQQPRVAQWNLARFAETLLPLLATSEDDAVRIATECLEAFPARFEAEHTRVMRAKLGLSTEEDGDRTLASDLMERLGASAVDFTVFFRRLCRAAGEASSSSDGADGGDGAERSVANLFEHAGAFHDWSERWRARMAREPLAPDERARAMRRVNPAFIPRNHRVEQAIRAAVDHGDFGPFHTLVEVLASPYEEQRALAHLAEPPAPEERVTKTFCGT